MKDPEADSSGERLAKYCVILSALGLIGIILNGIALRDPILEILSFIALATSFIISFWNWKYRKRKEDV